MRCVRSYMSRRRALIGRNSSSGRRTQMHPLQAMHSRMSSPRSFSSSSGDPMSTVIILGGNLTALSCAHSILDSCPDVDLHIVEESAEIGLLGEGPGIFSSWPVTPLHWLSSMGSQEPTPDSTAVRRSWLEKAMATSLSSRGCTTHLRTRAASTDTTGNLTITGAGPLGTSQISSDILLDLRENTRSDEISWEGGVCLSVHSPEASTIGRRSDGTTEIWWCGADQIQTSWVQRMSWTGLDPNMSLEDEIARGITTASSTVDTIIQEPRPQPMEGP